MNNNKPTPQNNRSGNDTTFWIIALVFLLLGAWPVSAIMATYKLFVQKSPTTKSKTPETEDRQKTVRNPYSATTSQHYTGSGAHPYTSTVHYEPKTRKEEPGASSTAADAFSKRRDGVKKMSSTGKLQHILGIVFAVMGLFSLVEPLSQLVTLGVSSAPMEDLFASLGIAICGGVLFGIGTSRQKAAQRKQNYLSAFSGERIVRLSDLAGVAGVSVYRVVQDLEQMVADGQLPAGAYVDRKRKCLVLDASTMQNIREKEFAAKPEAPAKQPDPSAAAPHSPLQETEYERILREIRQANDDIDDEAMSAKIDRIEQLSRSIFTILEQKPERRPEARSFFNYYLPTTQKLLDFYARLEDQPLQEGSIEDSRRNIENIMDNLIKGFEAQLDSLFRSEAMDITTEISVLENMLTRDGIVTTPQQQAMSQAAGSKSAISEIEAPHPVGAAVQSAPLDKTE